MLSSLSLFRQAELLFFRLISSRAGTLLLLLAMLLQRTPVVKYLFQAQLNPTTRVVQFWQAIVPAVTGLGAYQALSGATREISPATDDFSNPTIAVEGEDFTWAAKVDLSTKDADSWSLEGEPDGLSIAISGTNLATISGKPAEAGTFSIEVIAWRNANQTGTRSLPYFLELEVMEAGPSPESVFGDSLTLDADGWAENHWFGRFNVAAFPYIYHEEHGWLYVPASADPAGNFWFRDIVPPDPLNWAWTGPAYYTMEHAYLFTRNTLGWFYYGRYDPVSGNREFWDYNLNDAGGGWIVVPGFRN